MALLIAQLAGKTQQIQHIPGHRQHLFCGSSIENSSLSRKTGNFTRSFSLTMTNRAYPSASYIEMTVTGDLQAPSMKIRLAIGTTQYLFYNLFF